MTTNHKLLLALALGACAALPAMLPNAAAFHAGIPYAIEGQKDYLVPALGTSQSFSFVALDETDLPQARTMPGTGDLGWILRCPAPTDELCVGIVFPDAD